MKRLRAYLESIPALRARHELAVLPARQLGAGVLAKTSARAALSELRAVAGGGSYRQGADALGVIKQLNAKARAEGRLWEQLHPVEGAA